jgi:peptidyl-prolyl cis-trans isomerase C
LRRFAIVLLALALVLAACSGGDAEIARVGATTIKFSDVRALYDSEPAIDDSFRDTLFAVIALEALTQALAADYGVTVDPAVVGDYYSQFQSTMTSAGQTPAELLGVDNASLELVHFNAEVVALRDAALGQLVVDPVIVDGLFADPATLTKVCVKHILVATQEEADAAKARLAAGEDFATVADEISLDTGSAGGDLGCTLAGDYVDEFAQAALEAPLNEVFGPVQSEFGFHVLVVTERSVPTRTEYLAGTWDILSNTLATVIWGDWISQAIAAADVSVSEEYGTWTPDGILAPESETTTTTPATTTSTSG